MNIKHTIASLLTIVTLGLTAGCKEKTTTETVTENTKDAAKKISDGAEKAYDKTKDAVKDSAEAVKDGAIKAGETVKDGVKKGVEKTGEAVEKVGEKLKELGK